MYDPTAAESSLSLSLLLTRIQFARASEEERPCADGVEGAVRSRAWDATRAVLPTTAIGTRLELQPHVLVR